MKSRYKEQMSLIKADDGFEEETELLLQSIITKQKQNKENIMNYKKSTKIILAAALIIVLLTVTAFAAVKFLTPSQVAGALDDTPLAIAFESDDAILTDQSYTGKTGETGIDYTVRFYGAVRGAGLSKTKVEFDSCYDEVKDDCLNGQTFNDDDYYFVFSIEHADGSEWSIFDDGTMPLMISPLVDGTMPWQINIWTAGNIMHAGIHDNISYYVIGFKGFDVQNMRLFAFEGLAPSAEKFLYNKSTGEIRINPDFKGFIAEFEVPQSLKTK